MYKSLETDKKLIEGQLKEMTAYMYHFARLALEKGTEIEIDLDQIKDEDPRDIDVQVYDDGTGRINKMKLKMK